MQRKPKPEPRTQICVAEKDRILVRGKDLCVDLIGRVSFTEHTWLLLTGRLPSEQQRRVLDAALVAIAEHGLVASVLASRMTYAAAPDALQGAVAAGILGCGSVVLGTAEAAGRFFDEIAEAAAHDTGKSLVRTYVSRYHEDGRLIPGFGHPLHKAVDPRAQSLLSLSREVGLAGRRVEIALEVEAALPDVVGRQLPMNVSAAIAAVLLDAGYPLLALKGVPILARTAGLLAHLLEEQQHPMGFELARRAAASVVHDVLPPEAGKTTEPDAR